jgi:hypothetical protein
LAPLPPPQPLSLCRIKLKTRDGVGLFMKDTGGSGRTEGIAQARLIEYPDASHGIVLTERDRVTRDLQAFIAS